MTEFTYEDAFDKLNGIYAYDTGCVDSGIHDEILKRNLKKWINARDNYHEYERALAIWIRETYLSDEALDEGYGLEDVMGFLNWIEEYEFIPLPESLRIAQTPIGDETYYERVQAMLDEIRNDPRNGPSQ